MKKVLYFLLALTLGAAACDKKDMQEQPPDPPYESTLLRSFSYPNRGTVVSATHNTPGIVATANRYTDGMTLYFNASSKLNGIAGDAIAFMLNSSQIKDGYVGAYDIDATTPLSIRYVYSNGSRWMNLLNSWDGLPFEGQLIITKYDATQNLINGTYKVHLKNMEKDPAKEDNGTPDPDDKCDILLEGSFSDLKIKTS